MTDFYFAQRQRVDSFKDEEQGFWFHYVSLIFRYFVPLQVDTAVWRLDYLFYAISVAITYVTSYQAGSKQDCGQFAKKSFAYRAHLVSSSLHYVYEADNLSIHRDDEDGPMTVSKSRVVQESDVDEVQTPQAKKIKDSRGHERIKSK